MIADNHIKYNEKSKVFQLPVVNDSIDLFCKEKVSEYLQSDSNTKHLAKVNGASFSIEELVTKKVASDSPAIRNIINPWTSSELLKKIGLVSRKGKKAVNEYAFMDIRMSRFACNAINMDSFIQNKVRRCKTVTCKTFAYRDFEKKIYTCPECGTEL